MERYAMEWIPMRWIPMVSSPASGAWSQARLREGMSLCGAGRCGPVAAGRGFSVRRSPGKYVKNSHLRTSVRRAIIGLIAHILHLENTPEIPPPEIRP